MKGWCWEGEGMMVVWVTIWIICLEHMVAGYEHGAAALSDDAGSTWSPKKSWVVPLNKMKNWNNICVVMNQRIILTHKSTLTHKSISEVY